MRTLFGYAAAHGYRRIGLEVFATNTGAIRLYEREGFAHEGRRRGAVMVGEQAVDLLMMGRGCDSRAVAAPAPMPTRRSR